jgi:DNA polymerase/3'-5' exonuclease PolX
VGAEVKTETKKRFPLAQAQGLAQDLLKRLSGACHTIKIAGSVRRWKPWVGDVEVLAIPAFGKKNSGDLFGTPETVSLLDQRLEHLVSEGILEYRKNKKGSLTKGEKIKLFRDLETGIPVDVFTTTEESWWNYLVCRTGPKESNEAIAKRARTMGLKWEPYSSGFRVLETGVRIVCRSEREVFETVDLPYRNL